MMPMELSCGQCQGRLLADQPGTVVACPHCGAHLQVPGAAPVGSSEDSATASTELLSVSELVTSDLEEVEEGATSTTLPATSLVTVDQSLTVVEQPSTMIAGLALTPLSDLASHNTPKFSPTEPVTPTSPPPTFTAPAVVPPPTTSVASAPSPKESAAQNSTRTASAAPATVPKFWFFLVASYASAVTLALLFVLFLIGKIKLHPLESLPDIVPEVRNGEVELKVASPDYDVAPGHVLRVGQSQRFGSLQVTPLRVTEGPLRFEHVLNTAAIQRPPSEPVLKLWLKFENVSSSQTFAPLDPLLLFRREYQGRRALTNQFLCAREERRRDGDLRYLYEMSATSEFRLAGQQLETSLAPGQTWETFIPSEERIEDLTGDLVWRVQFRKGYHARTRHGVTTLIDVPFQRKDVKLET